MPCQLLDKKADIKKLLIEELVQNKMIQNELLCIFINITISRSGVNFINILLASFVPIFLRQRITKLKCN